MLESLTIRRIALIDEATIRFHDGMQVLTGETGAGKSIVVDSVNLILGGRADRELIRSGSVWGRTGRGWSFSSMASIRLICSWVPRTARGSSRFTSRKMRCVLSSMASE